MLKLRHRKKIYPRKHHADERNNLFIHFDPGIDDENKYTILNHKKKMHFFVKKNVFVADTIFKIAPHGV